MTTHARTIRATPARTALETWTFIVDLLCHKTRNAEAQSELEKVGGVLASIISGETLRDHPIVLMGTGPRVKIYCIYDEEAISGDRAREAHIAHDPFESSEWTLNVPCPPEDKAWVQRALQDAPHILVRLPDEDVERPKSENSSEVSINKEAFFRT